MLCCCVCWLVVVVVVVYMIVLFVLCCLCFVFVVCLLLMYVFTHAYMVAFWFLLKFASTVACAFTCFAYVWFYACLHGCVLVFS